MKALILLIITIVAIVIAHTTRNFELAYIILILYVIVNSIWSLTEIITKN